MQYRTTRDGQKVSLLGFGCMRFTKKGTGIDFEKAEREVMRAFKRGVNYYDTAYLYPGSEELMGRIFEKNGIRDEVLIATKLPQYLVKNAAQFDRFFNEELRRLRTDHVDFYLMHMITDVAEWEHLKKLGVISWIEEKKRSGQIRRIGFSFHGSTASFLPVLEAYDWDFCQIQYNYLDENAQAGREGLMAAAAKGIPVVIMEPLRGGKLVDLPADAKKVIAADGRGWSAAEWGLRWLWDQEQVTCVLSGMNSLKMVDENCRIASEVRAGDFGEAEQAVIRKVTGIINARMKIGCTGCAYCMPCPKGVDIPGTFRSWNRMYIEGRWAGRREYAMTTALRKESADPSRCVRCGKCETHCPQNLPIREALKTAGRDLLPPPVKLGLTIARKLKV